ncbi:MFS transporter [Streptomyces sp. NPDC085481]|uniref:MFS transporter n=1 Tax=Streptomyces sp. NPDC085481 TaxID=3365727 RepID=UPI0037D299C7
MPLLSSRPRTPVPTPAAAPPNVLVLAVAGAVTVANIYFPQPLLAAVARGLAVPDRTAGLVASAAQTGYALGLLLLVPLADTARLRRLTRSLLAATSGALLAAAAAPNVLTLLFATLALSTTTVLPQILTPVAAALAGPERRGRVVGVIGLGLTLGSTLSRTVSGVVSDATGSWRTPYLVAAVATACLLWVLPRALPERLAGPGRPPVPYGRMLAGLPRLLGAHRDLRVPAFVGACVFAAYSVFWAALVFHLAAPPLGYGPGAAGLFGLLTVPAALASAYAGRLTDRYGAGAVGRGALGCVGLGLAVAGLAPGSPVALVAGAGLVVLGTSACQIANQARVLGLGREVAARCNTVFMLATFGGGALGSFTAVWLYGAYGWQATVLAAVGFTALGGLGGLSGLGIPGGPSRPIGLGAAFRSRSTSTCATAGTRKAGGTGPRSPQGDTMQEPAAFDLGALADEHLAKARAAAHGRSAHVVVHDGVLRQSVIALVSGMSLDEHNAPPAASLQVLRGRVELTASGRGEELAAGQLQMLPKERHGLTALDDAVVLLTAVND